MGNYIDTSSLTERVTSTRLDQLCRESDAAKKAALLASIISRAEGLVDGYLGSRYAVPVPADCVQAEEWALDIAEYELYKRGSGGDVPEKIKYSYEMAVKQLKDVSSGKLALSGATTASASGMSVAVRSSESFFSSDAMAGW